MVVRDSPSISISVQVALAHFSAASARHTRRAAGYVASPCRSTLIYKPRPEGAPSHYCPVRSSNLKQVTGDRPSPLLSARAHRQIRTVTTATSGARGPAGRSRSAGGAAPAFLFGRFRLPLPRFTLPVLKQVLTRQLVKRSWRYGDRRARQQWHGERRWRCVRRGPGFCLPVLGCNSSGNTSAPTTLHATLELGPRESLLVRQATAIAYGIRAKDRRSAALDAQNKSFDTASVHHESAAASHEEKWHPPPRTSSPPPRPARP